MTSYELSDELDEIAKSLSKLSGFPVAFDHNRGTFLYWEMPLKEVIIPCHGLSARDLTILFKIELRRLGVD